MSVSRWQAIVFDLDDTLYPEREYVLSGFRAVAAWAAQHLDEDEDRAFCALESLYISGVRGSTFDQWLSSLNLRCQVEASTLVDIYRAHIPTIHPYPGISDFLDCLRTYCQLGLVSDGNLEVQQRKLTALGLATRFDAIVFSDTWGRSAWKPSTVPFRVVLSQLGIPASQTVYIGDNPLKDFLGARQLGISTIWLRHSDGEYSGRKPPTDEYAADLIVCSVDELDRLLTGGLVCAPAGAGCG